jgi:hypothetical protein
MTKHRAKKPSLEHLKRLTDDTGLFQHAKYITPLRQEGYTTDDNARALMVATIYYDLYPDPQALKLLDTYLAFVIHSQNEDGSVRNFINFDRTWVENEPANDALGRNLWALGTVIARPPATAYLFAAKDSFDLLIGHLPTQSPRGTAYAILGLAGYLKQFSTEESARERLKLAADKITAIYNQNGSPGWQWFEDKLTYDNAVLPHALFAAGMALQNSEYLAVAKKTCEFLLANTYTGRRFSFIGCNGWYRRGKAKAQFDQQPIEAAGTILMLKAAYKATKDKKFLSLQRKAFNWFLGENDLGIPLYDSATKGCSDGLGPGGINCNQGAESTLSFLLSRLTMLKGE